MNHQTDPEAQKLAREAWLLMCKGASRRTKAEEERFAEIQEIFGDQFGAAISHQRALGKP